MLVKLSGRMEVNAQLLLIRAAVGKLGERDRAAVGKLKKSKLINMEEKRLRNMKNKIDPFSFVAIFKLSEK